MAKEVLSSDYICSNAYISITIAEDWARSVTENVLISGRICIPLPFHYIWVLNGYLHGLSVEISF